MSQLRDTEYAKELKRADYQFPDSADSEARIERLLIKSSGTEQIRFSWWKNGGMAQRPLELDENCLLELLRKGIKQGVFEERFLAQLRDLLNSSTHS